MGSSDHFTVSIIPQLSNTCVKNTNSTVFKRNLRPSGIRDFGRWIIQQDWQIVFSEPLVKDKFEAFTSILSYGVDTYLPFRKIRRCSSNKHWITTKLKSLVTKRQSALHVNGKDSELYKFYRNAVQRECSIAKKSYYNNRVAALKTTNAKRWWKEIKKIKDGGCSSSLWYLQLLNDQNQSVESLVQRFNQFLQGLTADFQPLTALEQGVLFEVPDRFLINDYTAFQALRQVKANKSSGPDPTSNRIWSEFAVELAPVVRDIYSASMVQGYIPSQLKETVFVPIPKRSTPKSVEDDLRPITLTSQLAKVMESFTFNLSSTPYVIN